ncbi:hypothetical protein U91I_03784 [alpha proteobacterium U9-1i]|nr:hypothetical protein U91I_03784 [alpha proteobacterium U9-1i]
MALIEPAPRRGHGAMRTLAIALALLLAVGCAAPARADERADVVSVLNGFHLALSENRPEAAAEALGPSFLLPMRAVPVRPTIACAHIYFA